MMQKVIIIDPGDTNFLQDEKVDKLFTGWLIDYYTNENSNLK